MLVEHTLFGKVDKVKEAVERLRKYEPAEGYYLAFSGGKDSCVIKALADMSGVKYDAHYNLTTVDPPELVRFIKQYHPDVERHRPKLSMWRLIVKKTVPPSRTMRYCCDVLKEGGGIGRTVITGVRWEESYKRSKRRMVEKDRVKKKNKKYLHPIIDWTEYDIWTFIERYNIPYCSLYDEDFSRLGCIGCPLQGQKGMERDFVRWPKYYEAYLRAFERAIIERKRRGLPIGLKTKEEMMDWYMYKRKFNDGGLFDGR